MLDPSSFRSCAAPRAPAPSLQGRYRRRQARRYGARCWLTWNFLGVMRKIVMPGLVPGIHVLLLEMERKTWMAGTSPAMTKSDKLLRRQHRSTDQFALLQIDQRLIGFGQRHRRHRNGGDLLGADQIEQFLRLPEIADIAALDGDRLERDQRQRPGCAAAEQADDDELAALGQAVEAELGGLGVTDEIDYRADRPGGL